MEKRQDTKVKRIDSASALAGELGMLRSSNMSAQDYVEGMKILTEEHKKEALYSIGDLSPFLIEESPEREAEIEFMKRTRSYLECFNAIKGYQLNSGVKQ